MSICRKPARTACDRTVTAVIEDRRSTCHVCKAGNAPKSRLAKSEAPNVKARTRTSMVSPPNGISSSGKNPPKNFSIDSPRPNPRPRQEAPAANSPSIVAAVWSSAWRQGQPRGDLRRAPRDANQRKPGQIGACNQQNKANRQHQHENWSALVAAPTPIERSSGAHKTRHDLCIWTQVRQSSGFAQVRKLRIRLLPGRARKPAAE